MGKDLMLTQGWPLPNDYTLGSLLPNGFADVDEQGKKTFCGNGMHVMQMGSIAAYIIGRVMRKEDVLKLMPLPVSFPSSTRHPSSRRRIISRQQQRDNRTSKPTQTQSSVDGCV